MVASAGGGVQGCAEGEAEVNLSLPHLCDLKEALIVSLKFLKLSAVTLTVAGCRAQQVCRFTCICGCPVSGHSCRIELAKKGYQQSEVVSISQNNGGMQFSAF